MKILYLTLLALSLVLVAQSVWAEDSIIPIQTIILEAQGESLEGQIAVGEVIRNRAKRGDLSHEAVCMAYKQFSAWNSASNAKLRLSLVSGNTWQRASKAWNESVRTNITEGATHYFNPMLANPSWARSMVKTAVIANHTFYKEA